MDKEKVSVIAVAVNVILAILKIAIGLISNSSAVFAAGIDSAVDILSSILNLFGIKASKKPVDKEHPYGHYKFEVLSGLMITIILFLTGIWVMYEAYLSFIDPVFTEISYLALGVMAFSAVVNEIMSRIKIYYGKKESSISLLSDGLHSRIDVISSLVVFIGLFLVPIFRYSDSLLTLLIGMYIIKESFRLGKEATDSLLDVSAGKDIEDKIKEIAKSEDIRLTDIKTQKKGSAITANLIIQLPKSLSVDEATKISKNLRKRLIDKLDNLSYIAIQIKSHDVENDYYEPLESLAGIKVGKGFQWSRKERFKGKIPEAHGSGPGGKCICTKCGFETEHKRGIPCSTIKCPKCKIPLTRKNNTEGD